MSYDGGMSDFDDEPPTRPERPIECPKCRDPDTKQPTGRVLTTTWDGAAKRHRTTLLTCDLCGGRKLIGHATFERFKAMRSLLTIPPPSHK